MMSEKSAFTEAANFQKLLNRCSPDLPRLAEDFDPSFCTLDSTAIAVASFLASMVLLLPPTGAEKKTSEIRASKANYSAETNMATWTPERRARQAAAIRQWQPWRQSTGPKTAEGKAIVARNSWRGGHREKHRAEMKAINWAMSWSA